MFKNFIEKLVGNNNRTKIVLFNLVRSSFLKGISIIVTFVLIPLTLSIVDIREYGVIITITSIINWIAFFDIGIGNGLRNQLSQALAENNKDLAKKYISTAYFYIGIIFCSILVVYSIIHPFINWYSILNLNKSDISNLSLTIYFVVTLFVLRFVFQLIGVLLLSSQMSYLNDAIAPISNLLTLLITLFLQYSRTGNFYNVLLSISATPIVVMAIFSFFLFKGRFKEISPSLKCVRRTLRKDLLNVGFKFFVLQLTSLIVFSTSNFLIAKLFRIEDVTLFNIASKYFGIVLMVFSIFLTPFWSAFAHAWFQGDKRWIIENIKKSLGINVFLLLANLILLIFLPKLSALWLGTSLDLNIILSLSIIVFNFQMCYNNVFAFFLNGIGKIKVQLICAVAGGVVNIPITILLARYSALGLSAICIANIISLLPSSFFTTIQVRRILKNDAKGIWLQ